MRTCLKIAIVVTMSLALGFGFLHLFLETGFNFKRLHFFLFNLVSGGTALLFYSGGEEHQKNITVPMLYFLFSLAYAFSAFFETYHLTLLLSVPLLALVEQVRSSRFSFSIFQFFRLKTPASEKFHHAALLCLSLGIIAAALVMVNKLYGNWIKAEKFTMDIFFLGFSFPISLITFSVIFHFIETPKNLPLNKSFWGSPEGRFFKKAPLVAEGMKKPVWLFFKEYIFWAVNLGVILFFVFILMENEAAEMVMGVILLLTVLLMLVAFVRLGGGIQSKNLLISGMSILVFTGLTGVVYILRYYVPVLESIGGSLLSLHAFISIYGWNLVGIFIISRFRDFPVRLNHRYFIVAHWVTIFLLAPLGKNHIWAALAAVSVYVVLLSVAFFSKEVEDG